jgi:hypothetical protein
MGFPEKCFRLTTINSEHFNDVFWIGIKVIIQIKGAICLTGKIFIWPKFLYPESVILYPEI